MEIAVKQLLASRPMEAEDEPTVFGFVVRRPTDILAVTEDDILPVRGAQHTSTRRRAGVVL